MIFGLYPVQFFIQINTKVFDGGDFGYNPIIHTYILHEGHSSLFSKFATLHKKHVLFSFAEGALA